MLAVDGDFQLGGDDFDMAIVYHLLGILENRSKADIGILRLLFGEKNQKALGTEQELLLARQKIKEAAERAKIELSESDTTQVIIPQILGTTLDEEIHISEYNKMISPLVDRTVQKIQDVLRSANMTADDIDRVIFVGGSTRNLLVKERVTEGVKEPWISEYADEVVAHGVALVASDMGSPDEDNTPIELIDVTPFSLGVCAIDEDHPARYINSIIINKNSLVPCLEVNPYKLTTKPNQDNQLQIYMLQGESRDPMECLMIGKYSFNNISHGANSPAIIDIEYGYDHSGIITISAQDRSTGHVLPLYHRIRH